MTFTVITLILAVVFLGTVLSIKSLLSYDSEELGVLMENTNNILKLK